MIFYLFPFIHVWNVKDGDEMERPESRKHKATLTIDRHQQDLVDDHNLLIIGIIQCKTKTEVKPGNKLDIFHTTCHRISFSV